ncbi:unnamed protein product [Closterium sp. NIES-53]
MRDENNRILGAGQLTASQVDLRIDEHKFCKSPGISRRTLTGPPAPAARLQRRANHSRSSCGERTSRLGEATRGDPAPPGSAPPDSAPPGSAPPDSAPPVSATPGSAPPDPAPLGSAPPGSAPLDSAPPDPAPAGSSPLAAPESTPTSTGSTASTWDTPDGAGP